MSYNPAAQGLAGASDVALSNPVDGQPLTYNGTVAKWENTSLGLKQLPSGAMFSIVWDITNSVWKDAKGNVVNSRPSSRTDITMVAKGGATGPGFGVSGDIWLKDNSL